MLCVYDDLMVFVYVALVLFKGQKSNNKDHPI